MDYIADNSGSAANLRSIPSPTKVMGSDVVINWVWFLYLLFLFVYTQHII